MGRATLLVLVLVLVVVVVAVAVIASLFLGRGDPARSARLLRRGAFGLIAVEAVLNVEDEELHRSHFAMRGGHRPAERYLDRFEQIRKLQDYLVGRAREEGVAVITNDSIDRALPRLMDLVLDSVSRVSSSETR